MRDLVLIFMLVPFGLVSGSMGSYPLFVVGFKRRMVAIDCKRGGSRARVQILQLIANVGARVHSNAGNVALPD
jgi:hypothetical protein